MFLRRLRPFFGRPLQGLALYSTNLPQTRFDHEFALQPDKSKESYLTMIKIYEERNVNRRGHVEFIYAALKEMKSFGVDKDLQVYKALIDVLPKGKFISTNIFQAEFMHYPKQQQCVIDVLEQMEEKGVMPDRETEDMLLNIFGRKGYPLRKYWRMMYWMPKFRNINPWPVPLISDSFQLAELAIQRITSVDIRAETVIYQTKDLEGAREDTWIVSGQSPDQRHLVRGLKDGQAVRIQGPLRVWLHDSSVNYFVLVTDPTPRPAAAVEDEDDVSRLRVPILGLATPVAAARELLVHEQEESTVLACCATGTSSKDSLLSWVRHLELNGNPRLGDVPVIFDQPSSADGAEETPALADKGRPELAE